MDQQSEELPPYKHIERNDFSYRKHKKLKKEDIPICVCQYDANDPDNGCGTRCLNVLTSTECTPGYCPCGDYCKNQRFQKCENASSKLVKTEGRGWGLLADENIKAGQFVIEYCGEVISWKEAKWRSQAYEAEGLKDQYIISLNAYESIDATRKGSLARFINHSCQPNCEMRKWIVLGEIRVGIFAKQDIPAGTELAYDYNFEWYGGAKVRCLCGVPCCSRFLGAKSRGFQAHVLWDWEDNDDRYSFRNLPLYDSEDDEPASKLLTHSSDTASTAESNGYYFVKRNNIIEPAKRFQSVPIFKEPLNSFPLQVDTKNKTTEDLGLHLQDCEKKLTHKSTMISQIRNNSACQNYYVESSSFSKTILHVPNGRSKKRTRKQIGVDVIGECSVSREACQEPLAYEESESPCSSP